MRLLPSVSLAVVALVVLAAPAAAQGPERYRNEPATLGPEVFGDACGFPVELVDTFAAGTTKVFPIDDDGDQRVLANGGYRSTLTNLATGKSVDLEYFGRLLLTWRADGTVDVSGSGGTLNWFSSSDVLATLGQGIFLVHGHVTARVDAATFLLIEPDRVHGTVVDICMALS